MGTPDFRFNPHWPEIAEHFDGFSDISLVEMLNRRDVQLEDWLKNWGGGREYATVVVAASDSHRDGKNKANLTCTGTADQATINRAFALLPTINLLGILDVLMGRVVFLEGNYNLTGGIAPGALSVVELEGMGYYESTFKVPSATNGTFTMYTNALVTTAIRNLGFDPNTAGQASGTITGIDGANLVENCLVGGLGGFGVTNQGTALTGVSKVRDSEVLGAAVNPAEIDGCVVAGPVSAVAGLTVTDSECNGAVGVSTPAVSVVGSGAYLRMLDSSVSDISATTSELVHVDSQSRTATGSRRTVIANSSFSPGVTAGPAVRIIDASNPVVANNVIDQMGAEGIVLEGCTGAEVVGNTMGSIITTANTVDYITLKSSGSGGASDCYIVGNDIGRDAVPGSNTPRYCIRVDDAGCEKNTIIPNKMTTAVGTAQISDLGTGTIKTFDGSQVGPSLAGSSAQADDAALFWMGNQPGPAASATSAAVVPALSGTTAQADDAALFWMGNEPEPSAAPAIAALTVLTAMGGY